MSSPIVLVIFYSRSGSTEKLALAAAVGAVQGRAAIRLRRLADITETSGTDTLLRLRKEYIAPREVDVIAADGLVFAAAAGFDTSSAEWAEFISMLRKMSAEGKLAGKVAAVVDTGDRTTLLSFESVLTELEFITVAQDSTTLDRVEQATALGRKIADVLQKKRR